MMKSLAVLFQTTPQPIVRIPPGKTILSVGF
jgi:hypothetical protein